MFVRAPERHRPQWRWATGLLVAICVITFLWAQWQGASDWARFVQRWGTLSAAPADWRGFLQPERMATLFSTLWLHAGWLHLLGNSLFLLIFGLPIEQRIGGRRLLLLFLLGGALANLAAALSLGQPDRLVIGASGAVSAVIGAYVVLYPRANLGVIIPLGLWLEFVRVPAAFLIGLWAVLQGLFSFIGPGFGAIAWWAHLTGFALGLLAAPVLRRRTRA